MHRDETTAHAADAEPCLLWPELKTQTNTALVLRLEQGNI